MPKRVTIDDVARHAGVHKATVSRALNAHTQVQVNVETAERVRAAARELGYVPNFVARGLRLNHSMTVGVVIPDVANPIFPPIMRGIEECLQPRGYTALLANTDGQSAVDAIPEFLEYTPRARRGPRFRIFRTDRGYRVVGTPPSAAELEEALRRIGIKPGTPVDVGDEELEWQ